MKRLSAFALFFAWPTVAGAQNITVQSFSQAKTYLAEVFAADPVTVYSRCRYRERQVDYASCAYRPNKQGARAMRIE